MAAENDNGRRSFHLAIEEITKQDSGSSHHGGRTHDIGKRMRGEQARLSDYNGSGRRDRAPSVVDQIGPVDIVLASPCITVASGKSARIASRNQIARAASSLEKIPGALAKLRDFNSPGPCSAASAVRRYSNEKDSAADVSSRVRSQSPDDLIVQGREGDATCDQTEASSYEWLTLGSPLVGRRVRRTGVDIKGFGWDICGRVIGWVPAEANDGESLYHVVHDDGDEEDLDERGVEEAIEQFDARDTSLDGTLYRERLVKGKAQHGRWRRFQMLGPQGDCLPCREAIDLHLKAGSEILLRQDNPKVASSMSHARYEAYKVATTFGEMLALGAKL